jgi:hypothetical protein
VTFDPLIVINCFNRLSPLWLLVNWLEHAGHENIVLLDNASTFEPLLAYYEITPHTVVRLKENLGCRALWKADLAPAKEWFVLTDPDVVPVDDCPQDVLAHFKNLLDRHPTYQKAGFGLYLDDVPAHCPHLGHERALMSREIEPGVFESAIDTTFALYRPGATFDYRALRTGMPYMARHLSPAWYGGELTDEDRFYLRESKEAVRLGLPEYEGSSWARRAA